MIYRVGQGYDVHRLAAGDELILGGIAIPSPYKALGHSDADVLIHAVCDALLGAASMGDIGALFPDTDPKYKGIDSKLLLTEVCKKLSDAKWQIVNVDSTVCLQQPKLRPYIDEMRSCLAELMRLEISALSIKATTTEKLGFVGKEEGIAAHAIVMLSR